MDDAASGQSGKISETLKLLGRGQVSESQDLTAAYARLLRSLVKGRPGTQADFAKAVHISEPHLSSILAGRRLPSVKYAAEIAAQFPNVPELATLYAEARNIQLPALPAAMVDMINRMERVCQELPYLLPTRQRPTLSTLYVKQSVSSPAEARWPRDELPEEMGWVEGTRLASTLAQPFNDVFQQNDHLVIEGGAGLGKTTLARQLVADLAERLRSPSTQALIPLLVSARVLAKHLDEQTWGAALLASFSEEYPGFVDRELRPALFSQEVAGHRWLVVIDALDEIPDNAARDQLITLIADQMGQSANSTRFLVTTRPLELGETARLTGAGFYELQPFNEEALKKFARNWFNSGDTPEGRTAADQFLEQVRTAGLADILEVPLLAAIAAHIHQSAPDNTLPASRYELYARYIDSYAQRRSDADKQALLALAGDEELAWKIGEQRMPLLEQLALSYMTTETPLRTLAREYLTEQGLLPSRPEPKWEESLEEWLCQNGLLTRSDGGLRFLHQTFAEHLAASARAKQLPAPFSATDPEWDNLIRGMSLGDENDTRVVLHYLYQNTSDDAVIRALQNGTVAQRDRACELISQGVPCGDDRIREYLSQMKKAIVANSGDADQLRSMQGLVGRAIVRSWLAALLKDPVVHDELKITVIDLLRDHSPEVWRDGPAMLVQFTEDTRSPECRLQAAKVLAKFGDENRETAVQTLISMTDTSSNEAGDILEAVGVLAGFGRTERQEAAEILTTLATKPMISQARRRAAASDLARLGDPHLAPAITLLFGMVKNPALQISERVNAATELTKVSQQHRAPVAAVLIELAENPTIGTGERRVIAEAIPSISPRHHQWAARYLARLVDNPTLDEFDRIYGAVALGRLGKRQQMSAAESLEAVARDSLVDPFWRRSAAESIAELGRTYRQRAVDVMSALALDRTASDHDRYDIVEALVELGSAGYPAAVTTSRELLTDPAADPALRLRAGQLLANMGAERRDEVLTWCDSQLSSAEVPADVQASATILAATVDPSRETIAGAVLLRLGRSPSAGERVRARIAEELTRIGNYTGANTVLFDLCTNPAFGDDERRTAALALVTSTGKWRDAGWSALRHLAAHSTMNRVRVVQELTAARPDLRDEIVTTHLPLLELPTRYFNLYFVQPFIHSPVTRTSAADAIEWHLAGHPFLYSPEPLLEVLAAMGDDQRARVVASLHAQAGDRTRPARDRLDTISILGELGETERTKAIRTAQEMANEPRLSRRERVDVLVTLVRAGEREQAEAAVYENSVATDVQTRLHLAEIAIQLGGQHRSAASAALAAIATDPGVHREHRLAAVEQLTRLDEQLDTIDAVLDELASDTVALPPFRLNACEHLAQLGGHRLTRAVAVARALAVHPSAQPGWRMRVAQTLNGWRSAAARELADTLCQVTNDQNADPALRGRAARHLTPLGPESRAEGEAALRDIADAPWIDGWNRLWAAQHLPELGGTARSAGLAALTRLADEPLDDRVPAILAKVSLVQADDTRAWEAFTELNDIVANPAESGQLRLEAIEALLRVAPHSRRAIAQALRALAGDVRLRGWERRLAALRLGAFDLAGVADAAAALATLATDETCTIWERTYAAESVMQLEPARRSMVDLVHGFATTDQASWAERRRAAEALLAMSRSSYDAANDVLRLLAGDSNVDFRERCRAAKAMVAPGRARADGLALLDSMTSNDLPADVRMAAWTALADSHNGYLDDALAAAQGIADDETAAPAARHRACELLLRDSADRGDLAIDVLTRLIENPAADASDQAVAEGLLASRWLSDRTQAGNALMSMVAGADTERHIELAKALLQLDPRHATTARRILLDVLNGDSSPTTRLYAAEALNEAAGVIRVIADLHPQLPESL